MQIGTYKYINTNRVREREYQNFIKCKIIIDTK